MAGSDFSDFCTTHSLRSLETQGTRSFVFVSTPCLCASSDPAAAGERVVELNVFENVCVGGIESAMVRSA